MSKIKIKATATAFRFDPEVKDALSAIADREGRSMANMLEWLIRKHCEREGLGWPPGVGSGNRESRTQHRESELSAAVSK